MVGSFRASAAFVLLSVFSFACEPSADLSPDEVIRPVRVERVADATSGKMRSLPGVARSSQEMQLSFRVAGTVTEVFVKRGDKVEKNQKIASLDTKDVQLEIQRARASVARAKAEHRSAQADYERTRLLYADGSASRAELDAARALEESKRAMHEAEQKGLELSVSKLSDHELRAPLAGAIADVPIEVNENVQAGEPVALLNSGTLAEVEVAVPERLIQFCEQGAATVVRFDAIADVEFPGEILEVGVAAESGSTTFPVRVRLKQEDERVRSGMAAVVQMELKNNGDAQKIFLPPAAIQEASTSKERFVMIAVPTQGEFAKVKKSVVKIGEPTTLGVEVESGVKQGELVIVAGLRSLSDGMKVRLLKKDQAGVQSEGSAK